MTQGRVEPGWQGVRDAFEENLAARGEVGAAVCVYVDGRPVVDVWGGSADPTTERDWEQDTLQLFFSVTKGIVAVCALMAVERGELDVDAPVATYWPGFAENGKEAIPVRHLLSHQAGLPVIDRDPNLEEALAWEPVVEALEAQTPCWEPGSRSGYHALTYGWLVGETLRRVTGRTPGRFLAEEVAGPLSLDLWIGLPPDREPRVAPLITPDPVDLESVGAERRRVLERFLDPGSLASRALLPAAGLAPGEAYNNPAVHAAEIPGANGIGTARALARLYAALIGEVDGIRLLRPGTVDRARRTAARGIDEVMGAESHFGLGFQLALPGHATPEGAFGHSGAGGSLAFAHPEAGLSFAYVTNRMQNHDGEDPRRLALVEAAYSALGSR